MNSAKKKFVGARLAALLLALCLPLQAGHASGAQADGIYTIDYQIVQADNDSVSMANDYWEKPATVVIDKGSVQIQMTINHSQWVTEFKVPGSGGGYVNTRILSKDAEADTRKVVFAVPELPSSPMLAKIHVTVPDIDYDHDYTIRFDFKADSLKLVEAAAGKPAAPTPAATVTPKPQASAATTKPQASGSAMAKPQASVAPTATPQASAAPTAKPQASATVTPSPQASAAATTPGANAGSAGEQASPTPSAASTGASEAPEQVAPSAEPSASAAAQAADAEANADAAEGNAGASTAPSEAAGAASQPLASPKNDNNGLVIGAAAAIVVLAAGGVWWWRRSRLQGR